MFSRVSQRFFSVVATSPQHLAVQRISAVTPPTIDDSQVEQVRDTLTIRDINEKTISVLKEFINTSVGSVGKVVRFSPDVSLDRLGRLHGSLLELPQRKDTQVVFQFHEFLKNREDSMYAWYINELRSKGILCIDADEVDAEAQRAALFARWEVEKLEAVQNTRLVDGTKEGFAPVEQPVAPVVAKTALSDSVGSFKGRMWIKFLSSVSVPEVKIESSAPPFHVKMSRITRG